MRSKKWVTLAAGTAMLATMVSGTSTAFAKQGPPTSELTNNLSVPAIFVPGTGTFAVNCPPTDPSVLVAPTPINTVATGFEVPGYYYLQGVNTWQAQCYSAPANSVSAMGDFGDNLTSGALKSGTPIRVEVGLIESGGSVTMEGYKVIKLQTSLADNLSAYGTLATPTGNPLGSSYSATAQSYPYTDETTGTTVGIRVFDAGATFSLYNETTRSYVVAENTPMSAEINATGAIVYGYNWGVGGHGVKSLPTAGTYVLTFNAPNVTLNEVSPGAGGAITSIVNTHTVSITFTVNAKSSGGGRHS